MQDFRRGLQRILRQPGRDALSYGDSAGYFPLRRTISQVLASQGLQTQPENILITAGSQQALAMVSQTLLRSGDTVLVEEPTYSGALNLFRALGVSVTGIPLDQNGMRVNQLEQMLQKYHPKLIYTVPNFQNPNGACMSMDRRRQLLELAARYNVPILEDDYVGDLRFEGRALPALKAMDPGGLVLYVSTFSKMLMPGLRVGFLIADGPIYGHLVNLKSVIDLATSNLLQRTLDNYVSIGRYHAHLRNCRRIYSKRRDALVSALQMASVEKTFIAFWNR